MEERSSGFHVLGMMTTAIQGDGGAETLVDGFIDFYAVLQVAPSAEPEVIEKAYRALMLKYHPDRVGGDGERARQINEAYSVLGDSARRVEYDRETASWSRQGRASQDEDDDSTERSSGFSAFDRGDTDAGPSGFVENVAWGVGYAGSVFDALRLTGQPNPEAVARRRAKRRRVLHIVMPAAILFETVFILSGPSLPGLNGLLWIVFVAPLLVVWLFVLVSDFAKYGNAWASEPEIGAHAPDRTPHPDAREAEVFRNAATAADAAYEAWCSQRDAGHFDRFMDVVRALVESAPSDRRLSPAKIREHYSEAADQKAFKRLLRSIDSDTFFDEA